jgi:hypothetical protein
MELTEPLLKIRKLTDGLLALKTLTLMYHLKLGEALVAFKDAVNSREFYSLLADAGVDIGKRLIQKLMRLARNKEKILALATNPSSLSIQDALKLVAEPKKAVTKTKVSQQLSPENIEDVSYKLDFDKDAQCYHIMIKLDVLPHQAMALTKRKLGKELKSLLMDCSEKILEQPCLLDLSKLSTN